MGGVLAVSRAFGDKLLKQYVVADPEIKVCRLSFVLLWIIWMTFPTYNGLRKYVTFTAMSYIKYL